MTRSEAYELLNAWVNTHNELDKYSESLRAIIGGSDFYESPAMRAFWESFSRYTDVLGELLGGHADVLNWYWLENSMGKKALLNSGGLIKKPHEIRSIVRLMDLIGLRDDLKNSSRK